MTKTGADRATRQTITKLLSAEEMALLSPRDSVVFLVHGEEYLDLEHLEQGVHRAFGTSPVTNGRLIPRKTVRPSTWNEILAQLAPPQLPETD